MNKNKKSIRSDDNNSTIRFIKRASVEGSLYYREHVSSTTFLSLQLDTVATILKISWSLVYEKLPLFQSVLLHFVEMIMSDLK